MAPFALRPEPAAHKMLISGLVASAKIGNLFYAGLLKFFGPSVAPFAQEFGLGESVKMRDIKAIYWPVWRVDALLEGKVKSEASGKERNGWVSVEEGYVPGEL